MKNRFALSRIYNGFIYKSLKEIGCIVIFVLFFLYVIMILCCIYFAVIGSSSLFLISTLGFETTIFYAKVGLLCAFVGIVIGHLAHYIARKASFAHSWRKFFAFFTVANYVVLVSLLGVLYVAETVVSARHVAPSKISCQNNLRQISLLFVMYSDEHDSLPPLLSTGKRLIHSYEAADATSISTPYPWNRIPHFCPSDKKGNEFFDNRVKQKAEDNTTLPELQEILNNSSYMYLGYMVTNDEEMRAFAEAYKERRAKGLSFDTDLEVPPGKGTDGGNTILRLKKFCTESSSEEEKEKFSRIPVIWDRCLLAPGQHEPTLFHRPKGINVLFLDKHCEFIPYGDDRWPLTEKTMRIFWELENL